MNFESAKSVLSPNDVVNVNRVTDITFKEAGAVVAAMTIYDNDNYKVDMNFGLPVGKQPYCEAVRRARNFAELAGIKPIPRF